MDEHHVCQQGLHRGGDDLNYSQGEGDRQHQRGGAQEVCDQAGDGGNQDEVRHGGGEVRGEHCDGQLMDGQQSIDDKPEEPSTFPKAISRPSAPMHIVKKRCIILIFI